jgi:hypothetical protein
MSASHRVPVPGAAACAARGTLVPVALMLLAGVTSARAADEAGAAPGAPPRFQLEAGVTHDDNVPHARLDADKRSDQVYAAQLGRDWDFPLNNATRITLNAQGGGEAWARFHKLDRAFAQAQATLEYRGSGAFLAPTFGAFARLGGDAYRSTLRSGTRYALGASVSAPLTDRLDAFGAVTYDNWHARSAVFSGHRWSGRVNLDWALSAQGTLYLGAEYRDGDTTSSGPPSLAAIDIAEVLVADDAFADDGFLTYRFKGRTGLALLGYNHGLGHGVALDLSWRYARTTPRASAPFASGTPDRYVANQFALSVLWRF